MYVPGSPPIYTSGRNLAWSHPLVGSVRTFDIEDDDDDDYFRKLTHRVSSPYDNGRLARMEIYDFSKPMDENSTNARLDRYEHAYGPCVHRDEIMRIMHMIRGSERLLYNHTSRDESDRVVRDEIIQSIADYNVELDRMLEMCGYTTREEAADRFGKKLRSKKLSPSKRKKYAFIMKILTA